MRISAKSAGLERFEVTNFLTPLLHHLLLKGLYSNPRMRAELAMPVSPIRFDPRRALELVLYVANRVRRPTFHSVSKVLYFADREHLSRFGSLLTGDSYVAMRHGPVPSATYNLLKAAAGRQDSWIPARFFELVSDAMQVEEKHRVKPLRDADLDRISASQRECLDVSIKQNGRLSFKRLADKSHDSAWKSADENDLIELKSIAKTLPNAREVLAYLDD